MTKTSKLQGLSTAALIAEYDSAPRPEIGTQGMTASQKQRRVNAIVDLLDKRADQDDEEALAWFAK
jgi:hypothetical protein